MRRFRFLDDRENGPQRFRGLLLFCILLVLIISGCDRAAEPESVNLPKRQSRPVSLQLQWVTQCQFAGYFIGLEKGWYKDADIDLTIHPGGPDIVPVDLVTSGSRDFGTTLLAELAVSVQQGKPAIGIAQIQQDNGLRLLAKASSGIREPRDFAGKRIGVWLGGWEVQFNALLALEGIRPDEVDVISQGFSMAPFIENRLDVASAMIYNEYNMVISRGINPDQLVVIDFGDYGLGFPGDVLFTSNTMVRSDPELCRKMVAVSLRGWKYALDHQDEAVAVVLKHDRSGVAEEAHQKKMMAEISKLTSGSAALGRIKRGTISKMIDTLVRHRVMGNEVPPDTVFTDRFIPAN
ncbi:MAG: ABC transporter substrate-binding protein [Desulfobacterales bacterium]|nr:ABC transporter substrate-binding protein [Desulfobacterales bacterium]